MWPEIDAGFLFCHSVGTRGGDGLLHVAYTKEPMVMVHTGFYPSTVKYDTECCEHCPVDDCVRGALKPCLTEITYREYAAAKDDLWQRVSDGEDLCDILRDLDQPYNVLDKILRGGKFTKGRYSDLYPSSAVQKKMKLYLEKRGKNHGIS